MTELTDLSDTDALNTLVSGQSVEGNVANMGGTDDVFQAVLGMLSRFRNANVFRLRDNSDNTKKLAFDLASLTTATTRTLTVPDESGTIVTTSSAAGQAAMEAESTQGYVRPSHVKYSPGVAKCWVHCGIAGNIFASYGVSSVTDNGAGDVSVNQSITLASSNGVIVPAPFNTTGFAVTTVHSYSTTGFRLYCWDSVFAKADPAEYFAVRYGDL